MYLILQGPVANTIRDDPGKRNRQTQNGDAVQLLDTLYCMCVGLGKNTYIHIYVETGSNASCLLEMCRPKALAEGASLRKRARIKYRQTAREKDSCVNVTAVAAASAKEPPAVEPLFPFFFQSSSACLLLPIFLRIAGVPRHWHWICGCICGCTCGLSWHSVGCA